MKLLIAATTTIALLAPAQDASAPTKKHKRKRLPMKSAVASQFDDTGAIACSNHAFYGVAHKTLPCGTRVLFCYHKHCHNATVEDRGPYIAGRTWDLNQNLAPAIHFNGLDTVRYRILKRKSTLVY